MADGSRTDCAALRLACAGHHAMILTDFVFVTNITVSLIGPPTQIVRSEYRTLPGMLGGLHTLHDGFPPHAAFRQHPSTRFM